MGGRDSRAVEPGAEVLEHGEQAEDPSLLRHPGDAEPGQAVRRHALEVSPLERDAAARPARHAHDGLERGRLAHAIAAE